jgi:hypothetical protein
VANPLLATGNVQLLSASITIPALTQLNVIASNMTKEGIRLAVEGAATIRIPAMVGIVNSPQPYQMATVTFSLLKTQYIAALYKAQFESNSLLGNVTIRPDIPVGELGLTPYYLSNCSLTDIRELALNGTSAAYEIVLGGVYYINADAFN